MSVDSVATLAELRRRHGMRTGLLGDVRHEASRAFRVLDEERFQSGRAYVLIARTGVVRRVYADRHGDFRRENAELPEQIGKLV